MTHIDLPIDAHMWSICITNLHEHPVRINEHVATVHKLLCACQLRVEIHWMVVCNNILASKL